MIRYVVVNERRPKGLPRFCAYNFFHVIEYGYTRDLDDKVLYCSVACFKCKVIETLTKKGELDAPKVPQVGQRLLTGPR